MKRVFVAAGMSNSNDEIINNEAKKLGKFIADSFIYVQGGSIQGLMGITLNEFLLYSKNVEFLIPQAYYNYDSIKLIEKVGKDNFKAKIVDGESERLNHIVKCDFIFVLPGGTGTILELLFANETARSSEHSSNIILINTDGFYNNLLNQFKTNVEKGLSKTSEFKFQVFDSVDSFIEKYDFKAR